MGPSLNVTNPSRNALAHALVYDHLKYIYIYIYIYSERNRAGPRPAVAHASCGFAVGQFNIAGSKLLPSIPKAG